MILDVTHVCCSRGAVKAARLHGGGPLWDILLYEADYSINTLMCFGTATLLSLQRLWSDDMVKKNKTAAGPDPHRPGSPANASGTWRLPQTMSRPRRDVSMTARQRHWRRKPDKNSTQMICFSFPLQPWHMTRLYTPDDYGGKERHKLMSGSESAWLPSAHLFLQTVLEQRVGMNSEELRPFWSIQIINF